MIWPETKLRTKLWFGFQLHNICVQTIYTSIWIQRMASEPLFGQTQTQVIYSILVYSWSSVTRSIVNLPCDVEVRSTQAGITADTDSSSLQQLILTQATLLHKHTVHIHTCYTHIHTAYTVLGPPYLYSYSQWALHTQKKKISHRQLGPLRGSSSPFQHFEPFLPWRWP